MAFKSLDRPTKISIRVARVQFHIVRCVAMDPEMRLASKSIRNDGCLVTGTIRLPVVCVNLSIEGHGLLTHTIF